MVNNTSAGTESMQYLRTEHFGMQLGDFGTRLQMWGLSPPQFHPQRGQQTVPVGHQMQGLYGLGDSSTQRLGKGQLRSQEDTGSCFILGHCACLWWSLGCEVLKYASPACGA